MKKGLLDYNQIQFSAESRIWRSRRGDFFSSLLGLAPPPPAFSEQDLEHKRYLVHGEKLYCSFAVHRRVRTLRVPPPTGLAKYLVLSPLEKAELEPDLVVFLCNAEQGCRLVALATYCDGMNPTAWLVGSTCYMTITYPIVSGEINVNLMDYVVRVNRRYDPDRLFVSIPYHKMPTLMASIERCGAGTATMQRVPGRVLLKTGKP